MVPRRKVSSPHRYSSNAVTAPMNSAASKFQALIGILQTS